MGLIPVFIRAISAKNSDIKSKEHRPVDTNIQSKSNKDGIGWGKRKSKPSSPTAITGSGTPSAVAMPVPSPTPTSPASPVPTSPRAEFGAASPPAAPHAMAPVPPSVPVEIQPPAQPRQRPMPRIPSVMYCPVLDKSGFGYGNEERRIADLL